MFAGQVPFEPTQVDGRAMGATPQCGQFSAQVGPDLQLRLLEARDAEELFALIEANRSYLMRWLSWLPTTQTVDDTRHFIGLTRDRARDNQGFAAALCHHQRIVGVAGLNDIDWPNRRSSIGYWIAEPHQGKGLVTRACRSILDYGFGALALNRIAILCAAENGRSRAVPERLGFAYEGTIRSAQWLYDHFVDHDVYSMLRQEWLDGAAR